MATTFQVIQLTLQALSSFAIAGGLIFTAVQFRQAEKAQHVANFAKLVELQFQLRNIRVNHPELAAKDDTENLHTDRDVQVYYLHLMQLSLFEIAWYARQHGQIADDYFHSWSNRIWQLSRDESFMSMLGNPAMKIMHDDFDRFVRRLIASPNPPASGAISLT
jgi:hypothetical protein